MKLIKICMSYLNLEVILCEGPKSGSRDRLLLEWPWSASKNVTHKADRSRGCVDKRRSKYSQGIFLLQSFQRKKSTTSCRKVHACNQSPQRLQTIAYRRLVLKSGARGCTVYYVWEPCAFMTPPKKPLYTRGYMSRYLCIHMYSVLNICLM
jgi:hypothetical protein